MRYIKTVQHVGIVKILFHQALLGVPKRNAYWSMGPPVKKLTRVDINATEYKTNLYVYPVSTMIERQQMPQQLMERPKLTGAIYDTANA